MTGQPNKVELQQMNQLFVGLKEDNERLAEEIGNFENENGELQEAIEGYKETV